MTRNHRRSAAALSVRRIEEAHAASAGVVRRTPILSCASLSERCGGTIVLKAENLQRTGSFKLRGALNKLHAMGRGRGVVAGSAGNHAQSLAYAARANALKCEIFMPADAAVSKAAAVRAFGATVHEDGTSVDDCVRMARKRADEAGLAFVHPFDDIDIVAGQAGLGLELAADVPELSTVVIPIGGGGLAAGAAIAIKQRHPKVTVVGVQAEVCAPYRESLRVGRPIASTPSYTIADGIAIKRPGDLTLALISNWLDDVVTVSEEAIADAMVFLLERSKLVVEGAGAASVAALISGAVSPSSSGATVAVLSGGNVDVALLAAITARHETRAGRRARYVTHVADRPGALAQLLAAIAGAEANLLSIDHVRDGVGLAVREAAVEFAVETRGQEHTAALTTALRSNGYDLSLTRDVAD